MSEFEYVGVGLIFKFVDEKTNELIVIKYDKENHSVIGAYYDKAFSISDEDLKKAVKKAEEKFDEEILDGIKNLSDEFSNDDYRKVKKYS
ncbi:MAG: hypothetical protein IJU86_00925 [Firmicutes bacterium]|nr:hypothetical protein [Bacillota bacterium]